MERAATIVTLGGGDTITSISTFEEAFGEFSELRGKGRKRRHKRKSERQQNRIERRGKRKAGRQEIRDNQMEARQSRRDKRHAHRDSRHPKDDVENDMDSKTSTETNSDSSSQDQGSSQDSQSQDQGGSQSAGYSDQSQDSGQGSQDQGSSQDSQSDNSQDDSSQDDSGEDNSQDDGGEDDGSNFDGVMGSEDRFSELNDSQAVRVAPAVAELAKKIEWNKELVSRLRIQKAEAMGRNASTMAIEQQINDRLLRISQLETVLNQYSNFEGDFSENGNYSSFKGKGKKATPAQKKARRQEVHKAKATAKRERANLRQEKKGAKHAERIEKHAIRKRHGGDVTPIDRDLTPEISDQRIEVPSEEEVSESAFTGLNGLDLQNDYDSPDARTIELSSNFDGGSKKITITNVLIGVAIGAAAIWAINKYKLIDKLTK